MKRPVATLVLAGLALAAALASLVLTLQFLGVIPWGDDGLDFWGGKWAGVLLFGLEAGISFLVAYDWLTLKPWAFTITLLMAFMGISIPISSLMAGTETWSTALLPILVIGVVIALALRPDVRRATRPAAVPDSI
ncbi:hypothetical protein BH23CHL4_BH23CHL4_22430 [soil metagenome]